MLRRTKKMTSYTSFKISVGHPTHSRNCPTQGGNHRTLCPMKGGNHRTLCPMKGGNHRTLCPTQGGNHRTLCPTPVKFCFSPHVNVGKSWKWFASMYPYLNVLAKNTALKNNRKVSRVCQALRAYNTSLRGWCTAEICSKRSNVANEVLCPTETQSHRTFV